MINSFTAELARKTAKESIKRREALNNIFNTIKLCAKEGYFKTSFSVYDIDGDMRSFLLLLGYKITIDKDIIIISWNG